MSNLKHVTINGEVFIVEGSKEFTEEQMMKAMNYAAASNFDCAENRYLGHKAFISSLRPKQVIESVEMCTYDKKTCQSLCSNNGLDNVVCDVSCMTKFPETYQRSLNGKQETFLRLKYTYKQPE